MSRQDCLSVVDDNRMAIVLLYILRRKEVINQPTFENAYKKYKKRLKEVA